MYSVSPQNGIPPNGPNHISSPPSSTPPPRLPGPGHPPRPFGLNTSSRPPGSKLPPRPPGPGPSPGLGPSPQPPGLKNSPRPPGLGPSHRPPVVRPPPQPPVVKPPPRPPVVKPPPQPLVIPPPRPLVVSPPPRSPAPSPYPIYGSPQRQSPGAGSNWLLICTVVVLFQLILMISRIDLLQPFIDIESTTRHASMVNSTLTVEKGNAEHEREVMARERELWEKAKEDRVPHGAFWEDVWPAWDCREYGTREYWGVLRNIPEGWSETDACMNMPVEIKGVTVRRPYRCAYVRGSSHIHGYWMVDWDQPDCKPWYRDYQDVVGPKYPLFRSCVCLHTPSLVQGCTGIGSGKRRIEAQIVGINNRKEQNWWLLCNSTPLVWNLITYPNPAKCEERVSGFSFWMFDE